MVHRGCEAGVWGASRALSAGDPPRTTLPSTGGRLSGRTAPAAPAQWRRGRHLGSSASPVRRDLAAAGTRVRRRRPPDRSDVAATRVVSGASRRLRRPHRTAHLASTRVGSPVIRGARGARWEVGPPRARGARTRRRRSHPRRRGTRPPAGGPAGAADRAVAELRPRGAAEPVTTTSPRGTRAGPGRLRCTYRRRVRGGAGRRLPVPSHTTARLADECEPAPRLAPPRLARSPSSTMSRRVLSRCWSVASCSMSSAHTDCLAPGARSRSKRSLARSTATSSTSIRRCSWSSTGRLGHELARDRWNDLERDLDAATTGAAHTARRLGSGSSAVSPRLRCWRRYSSSDADGLARPVHAGARAARSPDPGRHFRTTCVPTSPDHEPSLSGWRCRRVASRRRSASLVVRARARALATAASSSRPRRVSSSARVAWKRW